MRYIIAQELLKFSKIKELCSKIVHSHVIVHLNISTF